MMHSAESNTGAHGNNLLRDLRLWKETEGLLVDAMEVGAVSLYLCRAH